MTTQSDLNVIWTCSICTHENQAENDLCEMCGAKKPNNSGIGDMNNNTMTEEGGKLTVEDSKLNPEAAEFNPAFNPGQPTLTIQEQLFNQLQAINTQMQNIKWKTENELTPTLIQLNQQMLIYQTNPGLLQLPQHHLQYISIQQNQIIISSQINQMQMTYKQLEANLKYTQDMYKCPLFNSNKKRCQAYFNEAPVQRPNVVQIIHLLVHGYLRNTTSHNSITEINSLIQKFYHDTNPQNFITKMIIDYKHLNNVVQLFSNQKHGVLLTTGSTSTSITSEIVYFSLQSQTRHPIKHADAAHRYNWEFCNGNLISLGRIDRDNYQSIMYNIASNTTYSIPQFLTSDRIFIGCCVSEKRGIFSIGGYYDDEDIDSVNVVHNVRWNLNDSNLNWNVKQLAPYWHDTWCSTPLFIDNDNKVVNVGGGQGRAGHCSQIVGLYDFETNKWSRLADIPYNSQSSGAHYNKFDNTLYVTGGYACHIRSCVCYSALTNQWKDIGQTNWSYVSPFVSVINNSLVLVIDTSRGDQAMKMEYLDIRTRQKQFTVLAGTDHDGNRDYGSKGGKLVSYRHIWSQIN